MWLSKSSFNKTLFLALGRWHWKRESQMSCSMFRTTLRPGRADSPGAFDRKGDFRHASVMNRVFVAVLVILVVPGCTRADSREKPGEARVAAESDAGAEHQAEAAQASPNPMLVFVHGRDQTGQDPVELEARWNRALDEGLNTIGASGAIPSDARQFVWYGDIYGNPRPVLPDECRFAALSPPTDLMERLRRALVRIATQAHLDELIAKQFVGDTYQFLSDLSYRCQTIQRLRVVLDPTVKTQRSVVLVAHSMGGIVSAALLQRNSSAPKGERYRISRFVTMGTQLGVEEVVKAVEGSMVQTPVPEPQNIDTWANFKNDHDLLAFSVRDSFMATDEKRLPVEWKLAAPGVNPHSVELYLRQPRTAWTVLEAYCLAAPEPKSAICSRDSLASIKGQLPN